MIINRILKQEHKDAGLTLEEDEHFVYLRRIETLAVWSALGVTIHEIQHTADRYVHPGIEFCKQGNIIDNRKHIGRDIIDCPQECSQCAEFDPGQYQECK